MYKSITLPAHILVIYFQNDQTVWGQIIWNFWWEDDIKIVLVSKCSSDIEQYVEFEMSVLISPSKSLISSRWVTIFNLTLSILQRERDLQMVWHIDQCSTWNPHSLCAKYWFSLLQRVLVNKIISHGIVHRLIHSKFCSKFFYGEGCGFLRH